MHWYVSWLASKQASQQHDCSPSHPAHPSIHPCLSVVVEASPAGREEEAGEGEGVRVSETLDRSIRER